MNCERLLIGIFFLCITLFGFQNTSATASMAPYQVVSPDWAAAVSFGKKSYGQALDKIRQSASYKSVIAKAQSRSIRQNLEGPLAELAALNAIVSTVRGAITAAGSPVLLPLDIKRLTREMAESGAITNKGGTQSYFTPFESLGFYPGPYGYRAYFRLRKTSTIMISGSSILYNIPTTQKLPKLKNCGELIEQTNNFTGTEDEINGKFFGYLKEYEQTIGLVEARYFREVEAAVPCLFAGALIEVHILCDDTDRGCNIKNTARSVFSALAFVGGAARSNSKPTINDPIVRLASLVESLERDAAVAGKTKLPSYAEPGALIRNSGAKGKSGVKDAGVYGPILFPTELTASAQTVVYRKDQNCLVEDGKTPEGNCLHGGAEVIKSEIGEWRDNFCEARSPKVFTCPAGEGHAGQDIWGKDWNKSPGKFPLRAVVDGIAFRRFPAQPAVTVSDVNGTNIDYIYRHMKPSKLEGSGIYASQPIKVDRGCVLAYADRLLGVSEERTSLSDSGRFYGITVVHLHFEIRVPTIGGYQNVSPYWTLAQSHRFLTTKVDTTALSSLSCKNWPKKLPNRRPR